MADQTAQVVPAAIEPETTADFLVKLTNTLREKKGVDVGLVDILEKYIITDTPAVGSVGQAKDAIQKLASERANPAKREVAGG